MRYLWALFLARTALGTCKTVCFDEKPLFITVTLDSCASTSTARLPSIHTSAVVPVETYTGYSVEKVGMVETIIDASVIMATSTQTLLDTVTSIRQSLATETVIRPVTETFLSTETMLATQTAIQTLTDVRVVSDLDVQVLVDQSIITSATTRTFTSTFVRESFITRFFTSTRAWTSTVTLPGSTWTVTDMVSTEVSSSVEVVPTPVFPGTSIPAPPGNSTLQNSTEPVSSSV